MVKSKQFIISVHPTINGILSVNWKQDYQGDFYCPHCKAHQLYFCKNQTSICKVIIRCKVCKKSTNLTCRTGRHIFGYQSGLACPNPLCQKIGGDGKTKGWVYFLKKETKYKCYYCGIIFSFSDKYTSWFAKQKTHEVKHFDFNENIWDLHNFYERSEDKTINFKDIEPNWYQSQVKQYVYQLLKTRAYKSSRTIKSIVITLSQFGRGIRKPYILSPDDITREVVLDFIDDCQENASGSLYIKLSQVKKFFLWLGLEVNQLIHRRDIPKTSTNDPDWLDETVRNAIRHHLNKLPAPIARQYLIQEYTAARPFDALFMTFDCLIEENHKWYVRFYQHKVDRWYQLPANREIRRIIEEQQQWIKQTLGEDYIYLFCHFRGIRSPSYPKFPAMKPLLEPSQVRGSKTPMVRIIRLLIERENILDANGKKPNFTGKITRSSRLQEIRTKHGIEAAQLYADHKSSNTTFQHYAPPTQEQIAKIDLPFQELLLNQTNRFLPWQSLPESLLKNPKAHELDLEIAPRLVVYGHCILSPKTPCPHNLYPKCYGCASFRPSTNKLPLYERQYAGEQQRMEEAKTKGVELAHEEAKTTLEAMDKWLPELRKLTNG